MRSQRSQRRVRASAVRAWVGAAALLSAVLLSVVACDERVVVEDYSGFDRFTFEQEAGLGFCPALDAAFTATIERSGPDGFTLAASFLRPPSQADAGAELAGSEAGCATGVETAAGCMVAEARATRALSDDEVARVRAAFGQVKLHPDPDRDCKRMGIDPCVIHRFAWDGAEHSDFVCGANRLVPAQARVIVDLLAGLPSAAAARAYLVLATRSVQPEPPAEGLYIAGELRGGHFQGAGEIQGDGAFGGDGHPGWLELADLTFHGDETGRAPLVPYVQGMLDDDGVFRPASPDVNY